MNILYLCDEYPPGRHGGIGTAVQLMARGMAAKGHRVVVAGFYHWGYGGHDHFDDNGVEVYRFRLRLNSKIFSQQDMLHIRAVNRVFTRMGVFHIDIKRSISRYRLFLENIIRDHKIDLVEMPDYNDYMRFCNSFVPFPELSVPVVVKMHGCMTYIARENGANVPFYVSDMERAILSQAARVSSVSKYNAGKTSGYLEYGKPVKILYNGIDSNIKPDHVEKVANRVIFTGTLTENKGIYNLISAWNLVNEKLPDAELWIYGKGPEKKIAKLLTGIARGSVFFNGHIPRQSLFEQLAKASVAIFPSIAESFAMAPMEAMACGTAVIYTERASGPELITNGTDGLLVNPQDATEIAAKIILLLNDVGYTARLASNGYQRIRSFFDIEKVVEEAILFYLSVVK